ncbi:hypothetical protein Psed_0854 [Pseudonocardia dioxanivorans CB1190]|uniref:Uncharacterized protein n=1 Tax=Pseudonocardia dioxanivorans (strain ATCC 55486 / DSM 44775 / JCM 13855 / CB1190) TaxID=675635 RepID=F4CSD4_PSEUX|nr:hypothetical protein [Pseudonocardia dioxanivorans]AEA23108.1 hypothetical protein Psed_0854 [Pseudonocardia dioxanivorans CB1190]
MTAVEPARIVVDGESWPPHGYLSPLDRHPGEDEFPTRLRGGVVTDPRRVAEIAARVRRSAGRWSR